MFIEHKKEHSLTNLHFHNPEERNDCKTIVDVPTQFITSHSSPNNTVTFDESSLNVNSNDNSSTFVNALNNSSILHSMVLTDDSLTFSVDVDQHGSHLAHIVAHGHNSSQVSSLDLII